MNTDFSKLQLPLVNCNEDLETISIDKFKSIFDVNKFELRHEDRKDKGIDFIVELKIDGRFSNFRFAVQIKSTEEEELNMDGSISMSIDTSNINYLLNNGMPAFYVLYVNSTSKIYYEDVYEFFKAIYNKNCDWNMQGTHTLRFRKIFDEKATDEMFQVTYQKGIMHKSINERNSLSTIKTNEDKTIIDSNMNVTSDAEIRKLIETGGFYLLNSGRWKEIVTVHKKATGSVSTTAKYNLVLGIANYYTGDFITALSFFRTANLLSDELVIEYVNQLKFYESTIKYSLGIMNEQDFETIMTSLKDTDELGLYIQLIEAKKIYTLDMSDLAFQDYEIAIMNIINNPNSSINIKLNAESDLLYFKGQNINMDLFKQIRKVSAIEKSTGPLLQLRIESSQRMIATHSAWLSTAKELAKKALEENNYFVFYLSSINETKALFEFTIIMNAVGLKEQIPGVKSIEKPDNRILLSSLIERLNDARKYFEQMGHVENTLATLHTLFEINDYMQEYGKSKEIMEEMNRIVTVYDFKDYRSKLTNLINGITTHKSFINLLNSLEDDEKKGKIEYDELIEKMKTMDKEEKNLNVKISGETHTIELWPIGHFQFPRDKKKLIYEILNVAEDIHLHLTSLFETIIPVVNIYNDRIETEGYAGGQLELQGLQSIRNLYRIRKAFFDNKFPRVELKFGL